MKKNKKGQAMQQLGGLAVGVAVLAILLTVSFLVLDQGKTQANDLVVNSVVVNETFSFTNATAVALGNAGIAAEETLTCTFVGTNQTTNLTVGAGNYTCDNVARTITVTESNVNPDSFNMTATGVVSYSWKNRSFAYNSTATLTNATQEIPGWVPLIIIGVVGALLLGLVGMFRRKNA